jgi:hypothetical protein
VNSDRLIDTRVAWGGDDVALEARRRVRTAGATCTIAMLLGVVTKLGSI